MSVFEELSVDDNHGVKNAPLSGEDKSPSFKLVHKHGENTIKSVYINCIEISLH